MTRYHVNPESGRPNICRAKIRCDFAVDGQEPPHFENKADAKSYGETLLKEKHGATATLTKKTSKDTRDFEAEMNELRKQKENASPEEIKQINGKIRALGIHAKRAKNIEEENSLKSSLLKETPKKLTPAQKEREEGRKHAERALSDGHDPDTLLKYANQHDAFAKGYTAKLQEESEKNTVALASDYFNNNIASNYGDIPSDHLDNLRNNYVDDVLSNPKAQKELKDQAKEDSEKAKIAKPSIERETIDTYARTLRVGDIITGEKFTDSGKWVEDDSAEVVKVEQSYNLNGSSEYKITYADGQVGDLGGTSNVKVKRDKKRISNKSASPTVIRNATRSVIDDAENGLLIKKDEFNKVMKFANQSNADIEFAHRLDRLANAMEDNNQHDPSIKASAASARIKMSYDKDYELDRGEAFVLLYDKDKTDSKLFDKLEKDYPNVAESAARSRENRAEINKQKAERGDTEYA